MKSWPALPTVRLEPAGQVTSAFIMRGISDFREAGRYLYRLPYGRNADRSDFTLVLSEGRGTCSTKHALLAALAREQGIPIRLMLAIYQMDEANTPGVGAVLDKYGLGCIPEAHCYVSHGGDSIDITRSGVEPTAPVGPFLMEEVISPEQTGDYKLQRHQLFMRSWTGGGDPARNFDELWKIREECIAALEQ